MYEGNNSKMGIKMKQYPLYQIVCMCVCVCARQQAYHCTGKTNEILAVCHS